MNGDNKRLSHIFLLNAGKLISQNDSMEVINTLEDKKENNKLLKNLVRDFIIFSFIIKNRYIRAFINLQEVLFYAELSVLDISTAEENTDEITEKIHGSVKTILKELSNFELKANVGPDGINRMKELMEKYKENTQDKIFDYKMNESYWKLICEGLYFFIIIFLSTIFIAKMPFTLFRILIFAILLIFIILMTVLWIFSKHCKNNLKETRETFKANLEILKKLNLAFELLLCNSRKIEENVGILMKRLKLIDDYEARINRESMNQIFQNSINTIREILDNIDKIKNFDFSFWDNELRNLIKNQFKLEGYNF
ncbi:unnamed protein product [Brachionus calyciflorus]|uniref:Uncharacterized protein n=1 Tax=Brachionus calyciflorus TaxID=104777 RepID=A0A813YF93_9BILA|nr:unnamed protein product [Brachionus calyciflorus]